MSLFERLWRNSFWKLLGDGSRGFQALALLILARFAGPAEFGSFALFQSVALLCAIGADLGINLTTTRLLAAHRGDARLGRRLLGLKLLAAPLWLLPIVVYAWIRPQDASGQALFGILCLANAAKNLFEYLGAVFSGLEIMQYESASKAIANGLTLMLGGIAVWMGAGIQGFAAALLLSYLIAFVIASLWCQRHCQIFPPSFDLAGFAILLEAFPIILLSAGLSSLNRWDLILLGWFGTPQTHIGWFGAAEKIIGLLAVAPALISMAGYPVLSDLHENDRRQFNALQLKFTAIPMIAGLVCAIALVAGAEIIIRAAFGDAFSPAAYPLRILAVGLLFTFPNYVLLNGLVASSRAWEGAGVAIGATGLNVMLNMVFIPRWGLAGAACVSTLTQAAIFTAAAWLNFHGQMQESPQPYARLTS